MKFSAKDSKDSVAGIILFVVGFILIWLFGGMTLAEFFAIRKHNAAIDKKWRKDGRPITSTTVGWRPDPHNQADGYRDNGDGSYSILLRGGTAEYRAQFEKDVEASKHA